MSTALAFAEHAFTTASMARSTVATGCAPTWVPIRTIVALADISARLRPPFARRGPVSVVARGLARRGGAAAMVVAGNAPGPADWSATTTATVTTPPHAPAGEHCAMVFARTLILTTSTAARAGWFAENI